MSEILAKKCEKAAEYVDGFGGVMSACSNAGMGREGRYAIAEIFEPANAMDITVAQERLDVRLTILAFAAAMARAGDLELNPTTKGQQ